MGCHALLQGIFWPRGQTRVSGTSYIAGRILTPAPPGRPKNTMKKKWKWKSLSCLILCDPKDYTVHGILQAKILEWVAIPFSRGSSQLRDQAQVSQMAGGFFTNWATSKPQEYWSG